jgi:hypothetical protein
MELPRSLTNPVLFAQDSFDSYELQCPSTKINKIFEQSDYPLVEIDFLA